MGPCVGAADFVPKEVEIYYVPGVRYFFGGQQMKERQKGKKTEERGQREENTEERKTMENERGTSKLSGKHSWA